MQNIRLIAHTKRDKPFCCGENCAACDEERRKGVVAGGAECVSQREGKLSLAAEKIIPLAILREGRAQSWGGAGVVPQREENALAFSRENYPACDEERRKGHYRRVERGVYRRGRKNCPRFRDAPNIFLHKIFYISSLYY